MNVSGSNKIRRWLDVSNRWMDSWMGHFALAAGVVATYLWAYQIHPVRPGADPIYPLGWWGWWDQGQYLKCTVSLARGSLTPDTYWYPLGYPAIGALFYRFMPPLHAFLLPDLILVVAIALLFYRIARKLISPVEALLLLVVFALCYRGTLSISLVEPWNTIPTHFLAYAIILLVGLREPIRRNILLATLCVGCAYLCRPPDALCVGLVVAVAILRLPGWGQKIRTGLVSFFILLVFVAAVLLINRSVFGSWRTPYENVSANIGFGSYPWGQKMFSLAVDGEPVFRTNDSALLLHFPWLMLLPPGLVYFIRRYKGRAVAVLASVVATCVIYFAYNDFWPGNVFLYHLIHYLLWTLPVLALITYVGLKEAWKDRLGRWSFGLMLPLVFAFCFLTLRENVSARISTGKLPEPRMASAGRGAAWILFREANKMPKLLRNGEALRPFMDFVVQQRDTGWFALLSTKARKSFIAIDPRDTPELQTIDYGTLRWGLLWPPRPLTDVAAYLWPARITLLGKIEGVDLEGPQGTPDGQPDEVIQVEVKRALLERICDWDIATVDGRGRWLSAPNPNGWWLIKTERASETTSRPGEIRLRLCFADYGDFEKASAFVLRATDIDGNLLINQTIQK